MTTTEIITIVVCLLLGYKFTGYLFNRKPNSSSGSTTGGNATDDAKQNTSHQERPSNEKTSDEDYNPANWFRILEVPEYATKDQISAAYKQKIHQYHPDKVAHMGTEIRVLAELKSKQIITAYKYAMKQRG